MDRKKNTTLEKTEIEVAYIPILCSAPLILAHARGIFENNGLRVNLRPAPGWSGIKELIAYDKIDAAHMLSPMPLACNLGIDGKKAEIKLAAIQNINGQALTLARKHLGITSVRDMKGFTFGVPYRFSMHYYLLCHYLAQQGIHPLTDVTIIEVAPPNMPYYLEQGWVDGVLAPEPYNQIPVNLGTGFIHVLSKDIWEGHPCCGFATSQTFAERNPNTYAALLRSIIEAEMTIHSADSDERRAMARNISGHEHLGLDDALPAEQVLSGEFPDGKGGHHQVRDRIDFVPQPFHDYGSWMLSQAQRWGQLRSQVDYREIVESTFDSEGARDIATAVGYSPDLHASTSNIGFDGKAPFAYMKGLPFCEFQDDDTRKPGRPIPSPLNERLEELNKQLAGVVGSELDVTFSVEGDDELGRLEELLGEMVLNTKFARLLLTDRNARLRASASELQRSEGDLRATLASIGDGVIGTDTKGRVTRLNKAAEQLTGWTENDAIGHPLDEVFVILSEQTHEPAPDPAKQVQATGRIKEASNHAVLVSRDGTERAIEDNASPIRDASGATMGVVLVFQDITERRRAEANAREMITIIDTSPVAVFLWRNEEGWPVETVSNNVERIMGYTAEDFLAGRVFYDKLIHPDDLERVTSEVVTYSAEADRESFKHDPYRVITKGGTVIWVDDRTVMRRDTAGRITHYQGIILDVSEQKKAEEELRKYREHLEDLVEIRTAQVRATNEVLLETLTSESVVDVARTCLSVAEKLVGSKFGFIGEINEAGRFDTLALSDPGWKTYRIPESDAVVAIRDMEIRGIWATVLKDEQSHIVNSPETHPDRVGTPEGHPPLTSFLGVPLTREGKTFGIIALANKESGFDEEDQTAIEALSVAFVEALHRKRTEERSRKLNQELTATNKELEAFAYSVSHDLRAPLRGIDGFSRALVEDYSDQLDDTARNYLARMSAAAVRMGRLIDDILKLSRLTRSEMRFDTVDLSAIAEKIARELRQNDPERQTEIVIAPDLSVHGDAELLEALMRNLLGNAWKFTGGKEHARIEFGIEATDKGDAYLVRDNGAGFDMSYAAKLFGAFQRLHSTTEFPGTGIGLAIVQRVILRHGGQVWGTGKVDEGATFYFTLPK